MITVVSGEPRSGTSLMMRLLEGLRFDIKGSSLLEGKTEERLEHAKKLNPKGFYEVPGVVMRGIPKKRLEEFDGKTVKLITPALMNTDYSKIGKIIFCLRDPREISLSQKGLGSNIKVFDAEADDWVYAPEKMLQDYSRYALNISKFVFWLKANSDALDKILFVDYKDVVFKTETVILGICDFFGIGISKEALAEVVALNDKSLYRSKEFDEYPDNYHYRTAMILYAALYDKRIDEETLRVAADYISVREEEGVTWIDDVEFGTWVRMRPDLYFSVKTNNNKVRDILLEKAATKRDSFKPIHCFFYDTSGEDYTINRPFGIGRLKRSKIKCEHLKKEVTREECYRCWIGYGYAFSMRKKHIEYSELLTSGVY